MPRWHRSTRTWPQPRRLERTRRPSWFSRKSPRLALGSEASTAKGHCFRDDKSVGYYSTSGFSFGLQAGAQTYGYAMFFMNAKALQQLDKANGFEVGVGPSIVVLDEGKGKYTTTTTAKDDIYAFIFGQKGLMAGHRYSRQQILRSIP